MSAMERALLMSTTIEIRRHPRGGYTLAVPVGGTARIYEGWFTTRRAAALELARRQLRRAA
jgi:hypothetical protein